MKLGPGIPGHDNYPVTFKALDRRSVNRTRPGPPASLAGRLGSDLKAAWGQALRRSSFGRGGAFVAAFAIKVRVRFGQVRVGDRSDRFMPMPPSAA